MGTRKITDGYGIEIEDLQWLSEHLFEYKTFDAAAKMVNPMWTRHHIHKEIKYNRVFPSELLIVYDYDNDKFNYSGGRKMFISVNEIKRIKEDFDARPKRQLERCEYCNRIIRFCKKQPCKNRKLNSPQHRQTVEQVAIIFSTVIEKLQTKRKPFSELDRYGNPKKFKYRT